MPSGRGRAPTPREGGRTSSMSAAGFGWAWKRVRGWCSAGLALWNRQPSQRRYGIGEVAGPKHDELGEQRPKQDVRGARGKRAAVMASVCGGRGAGDSACGCVRVVSVDVSVAALALAAQRPARHLVCVRVSGCPYRGLMSQCEMVETVDTQSSTASGEGGSYKSISDKRRTVGSYA